MDKKRIERIYSRGGIRLPRVDLNREKTKEGNFKGFTRNIGDKNKVKKIIKIAIILLIASIVVDLMMKAVNPIIDYQCIEIAKSIATKISNEEATRVMAGYKYEDLCKITIDKDKNIKMINMDMITVNKIISDIPILIQNRLEQEDTSKFYIRLGSFTGNKLLAGRGPNVEIKMSSVGTVETDLKSEFESKGINQTMHRIYLEVRCSVVILTPFNTIEEEIVNQVLLAENLIVGNIPNTYYNIEGLEGKDNLELVN